jgi:hypothetical protein
MAFCVTGASGCQSFMPSDLGRSRNDAKILKQAELDPFPSPADVGLEDTETNAEFGMRNEPNAEIGIRNAE